MFQIKDSACNLPCDGERQNASVVLENVAVGAVGAVEKACVFELLELLARYDVINYVFFVGVAAQSPMSTCIDSSKICFHSIKCAWRD
jgi:hypothetical protein